MLIDQFENPIPNNQQTAICVECGMRKNTKSMGFTLYPINNNLTVKGYFCNENFCTQLNKESIPGRIQILKERN